MSERKHNSYLIIFTFWLNFTSRVDKVRAAQMEAWNTGVNSKILVNTLSESVESKSMNTTQVSVEPYESGEHSSREYTYQICGFSSDSWVRNKQLALISVVYFACIKLQIAICQQRKKIQ